MAIVVEEHVSLKSFTTFKTGGNARYFVSCATRKEILESISFSQKNNIPFIILGEGSNVIVSDDGFHGVIIHIATKGKTYAVNGDVVYATYEAGEILDEVIEDTIKCGYWGLENLSHIPGTVGATPVQNVGAYGVEVGSLIHEVAVYDTHTKKETSLLNSECNFSYRNSIFKSGEKGRYVLLAVTFILSKGAKPILDYNDLANIFSDNEIKSEPTLREIRQSIIAIRENKFPDWRVVGTAGSFYKNPIVPNKKAEALLAKYPAMPIYNISDSNYKKISLGWILDKVCNLKGYKEKGVGTYVNQALVLVSYSRENTTQDVLNFSQKIKQEVYTNTGIHIEEEVTYIS